MRSDSAARVAATLGYKNIYRDPKGYPEWQGRGLPIESAPTGLTLSGEEPKAPGPLYGWAMIRTLQGIFAGGMALNLTPCVYPLIPITVSYFGGQAARAQKGQSNLVAHAKWSPGWGESTIWRLKPHPSRMQNTVPRNMPGWGGRRLRLSWCGMS